MTQRLFTAILLSITLLSVFVGSVALSRAAAQEERAPQPTQDGLNRICFTDMFEPNETFAAAKPITVGFYTPLYVCAGENDYYSIELQQGQQLQVDLLFTDSAGDLELRLYNSDEIQVASGGTSSDNESATVRAPTAGTYYILAFGWLPTDENSYEMQVSVSCPSCISYQGQLQDGGSNATGSYEFEFSLYDAPADGTQIGDKATQVLPVVDGLFSAELYLGDPNSRADIYPQFLNIGVRPTGNTDAFTTLTPRTELTAAPTALTLVAGALISGDTAALRLNSTSSDGLYVQSAGDDGLDVQFADDDGISIINTNDEGIYIQNAGETGVWVDNATKAAIAGENASTSFAAGQFLNTNHTLAEASNNGGIGLYARGLRGTSATTNPDAADIVLGGHSTPGTNRTSDDGRISSDPAYSSSDLEMASMDKVWVLLDDDANSTGAYFAVYNHSSEIEDRVFYVQDDGDVFAKSYNTITRSAGRDGEPIVQYGATAMQQRIEDFGTASLIDGVGIVPLGDNFTAVANTSVAYQVFLTPRGDCPLYLAETTASSFTVQAMGSAACSIDFDYRVVAAPLELVELQPEDSLGDDEIDASEVSQEVEVSEEVSP